MSGGQAVEIFAGEFLRRVNAEVAANGDFAGGLSSTSAGFGEDAVALGVGVMKN